MARAVRREQLVNTGMGYLHPMRAHRTVCGLVAGNVGSVANNVGRRRFRVAQSVGPILPCLRAQAMNIVGRYS